MDHETLPQKYVLSFNFFFFFWEVEVLSWLAVPQNFFFLLCKSTNIGRFFVFLDSHLKGFILVCMVVWWFFFWEAEVLSWIADPPNILLHHWKSTNIGDLFDILDPTLEGIYLVCMDVVVDDFWGFEMFRSLLNGKGYLHQELFPLFFMN